MVQILNQEINACIFAVARNQVLAQACRAALPNLNLVTGRPRRLDLVTDDSAVFAD